MKRTSKSRTRRTKRGRTFGNTFGAFSKSTRRASGSRLQLESLESRIVLTGTPFSLDVDSTGASNPAEFVQIGSTVYFAAEDIVSGRELWQTDGTIAGTSLLADINPNVDGSSSPTGLIELNGSLLFAADDGTSGEELWVSDGTTTVLLNDINSGEASSSPRDLVQVGNSVFFTAETADGRELWVTDGTQAGTTLVSDINAGADSSNPQNLIDVDGVLFFTATDTTNGRELWSSDGTGAGTTLVSDIFAGVDSSAPQQLTEVGGEVFFVAETLENGTELWKSDGTATGTVLVKDIIPTNLSGVLPSNDMIEYNGVLLFAADDGTSGTELWISDGTEAGTELLQDIQPGATGSLANVEFTQIGAAVVFAADDGSTGSELWVTLGTPDSTSQISDINIGPDGSSPRGMIDVDNVLFFSADDGSGGQELWESRGTGATTFIVAEIGTGSVGSNPTDLFNFDSNLLFSADDGSGTDLWAVDTTAERLAAPINLDLVSATDSGSDIEDNLTSFNNADAASMLVFTVGGVTNGAMVQIYSDDVLIGTATAFGDTATINTDGSTVLADGMRVIRATQTFNGGESESSSDLLVTIDTAAPAVIQSTLPTDAQPGQLYTFDADSADEGQAGVVYSLTSAPTGMTIDPATGVIEWTPGTDAASPTTFDVLVSDAAGNSVTNSGSVTIAGVVAAVADAYSVAEDATLNIDAANGVLANDGTGLTATLVDDVTNGTLTLNSDGSFDYVPNANFNGTDEFTYRANDGTDDSEVTVVTLTVTAENDTPTVVADAYSTSEGTALTVDAATGVLANDSDLDGDTLTVTLATQPTNGVVQLNTDGSFTYTPTANFSGDDSFRYTVNDGTITSEPVLVSLTVTDVANSPVPAADTYDVTEDTELTILAATGVLANDQDADGNNLTLAVVTQPSNGTVSLQNDGSFTYTPDSDFNGTDTFTYTINDGTTTSAEATVTLNVAAANDAPIADDDTFTVTNDGTLQTFDVLSNDSDPDGGTTLTITSVTDGSNGGTIEIDSGQINYTPAADFTGTETFTYTVEDADGLSDTATVSITVEEPDTQESGGTLSGVVFIDHNNNGSQDADEAGVPGVLLTLTGDDADGNAVNQTIVTENDGTYQFTNVPVGTAYTVTESQPNALADPLGASNEVADLAVTEGEDTAVDAFPERYLRPQYHSAVWCFARQQQQTTQELLREIVAIGEEDAGNDDLAARIRNNGVEVTDPDTDPAPDPDPTETDPVAVDDTYTVTEGETLTVAEADGILDNDTDPNSDALTATVDVTTTNGTLTLNDDGSFEYDPNDGFTGNDTFTYTASDGTNTSNTATVTITVEADTTQNTAPVTVADTYNVDEDITLTVGVPDSVLDNDSDADADTLTATVVNTTSNGSLTLNTDGTFTYTPNADFNGDDTFTYIANDGTDDSNESTVTITVNAVNDSPIATADSYTTMEDSTLGVPIALGVLDNDSDIDSTNLTATIIVGPNSGELMFNQDGSFNYVPVADFEGEVTFIYEVNDGDGATSQATATITVTGVNDGPTATDDSYQVDEDTALAVDAVMGLLANDTDPESDVLTATVVNTTSNGTLNLIADGSFDYTPNANFAGTDSFTYQVSDGNETADATVTIEVRPIEDSGSLALPAELTDPANVPSGRVGEPLSFDIDVNDPDEDDVYVYQLDLEASGIPADATMPVIDPSTGVITWTPSVAGGPFEIRVIVVNQNRFADQETFLVNILASDVDNSL